MMAAKKTKTSLMWVFFKEIQILEREGSALGEEYDGRQEPRPRTESNERELEVSECVEEYLYLFIQFDWWSLSLSQLSDDTGCDFSSEVTDDDWVELSSKC